VLEYSPWEEETVKPEDVVWPWRMEQFAHDKTTLSIMKDKLYDRGYDFKRLAENPPVFGVEAAERLICEMFRMYDVGEVPWVLLWGQDLGKLQSLARLVPLGVTLLSKRSCEIVDNSRLVELFFSSNPRNAWEDDPSGETIEEIKMTGTLVWNNVNMRVGGADRQTAKFAEIISHRVLHRLFTVFTVVASSDSGRKHALTEELQKVLGPGMASQVDLHATPVHVKGEARGDARKLTVVV